MIVGNFLFFVLFGMWGCCGFSPAGFLFIFYGVPSGFIRLGFFFGVWLGFCHGGVAVVNGLLIVPWGSLLDAIFIWVFGWVCNFLCCFVLGFFVWFGYFYGVGVFVD